MDEEYSRRDRAAQWGLLLNSAEHLSEETLRRLHEWVAVPRNGRSLCEVQSVVALIQELPAEKREWLFNSVLPGHNLAETALSQMPTKAFNRYVAPTIADMQEEHADAIAAGNRSRARWILIRGHLLIIPGWLYALFVGVIARIAQRGR